MEFKEKILSEFIKKGYSKKENARIWHINNPSLLFLTPELARGFLDLEGFNIYRENVIGRELFLIKNYSKRIIKSLGDESFNLIDMRCAGGERASLFIRTVNGKFKIRYCPVGMHPSLSDFAIKSVKKENLNNVIGYNPEISDFESLATIPSVLRNNIFQKNVILLFGSTLSLFDINEFLFDLSTRMFKGDLLVIGNGIRQGERLANLSTYQHESFNNWFMPLMKEIGFKDSEVEYGARFGDVRIECFYRILTDKDIKHKDKEIKFKKGDEVLVATIYKYYEKELKKFCKMYFSKVEMLKDDEGGYVMILCRK